VPNRKTGAVSYKTDVVLGKKLTANMLFCRFQLDRLGKIGGVFKMLTGTLQGQIELSGDPACPVFRSIPASRRINPLLKPGKQPCRFVQKTSHLLLTDLVLGNKPKPKKRRGFGRRKKKSTAFLHISKLRFDMKSIEKGRFRLQLSGKRAACVRHKFKPSGAAGRAKLKRLLAVSKRECPHKSVTPPRRAGFPWWMWRLKRTSSLLSLDVKSPFPSLAGKLKPADARRRCPHWKGSAPLKDLYVNFSSPGIPLEFVESFVYGLKQKANFGANVLLEGKGNNPPVIRRGQVNIDLKDMRYPAYGVRLLSGVSNGRKRRSYVRLLLAPTSYKVRGQLEGVNGTPFKILGKITHKNFVPQSYDIRLRAKSFKPMDTIKYKLTLRTNIDIKKSAKANAPMWVRGRVEIPRMLFTLPDSSGGPSTYNEDGDIIVLGEPSEKRLRPKKVAVERPKSSGSPLFIDLKIKIPRNFVVRNRDLQVEAKTDQDQDLGVTMGNGSLKLSGGIEIVRGELSQFGKRFSVQTGSRVSFTGQSMPLSQIGSRIDPRLQIAAVYVLKPAKGSSLEKKGHKKVKVFLIVSGSLQKLKFDFEVRDAFSGTNIDLDQVNVIALLLTGSTTDDLSSGQQKNLTNQAFGMLGRAIASELRNQLSSVVPLDVLNIETGTRAEDLKVDVGWYLNPSVYFQLSVKPVPLDEESYWEALVDWSINRQLSLEARAGQMKRNDSPLFRGSA
jgi:autotransporter translocation and assembly factor TamB